MATSDGQSLLDLAKLIVEDNQNTIDAIEELYTVLRNDFDAYEVRIVLRTLALAKATFTVRVKEIMERPEPKGKIIYD